MRELAETGDSGLSGPGAEARPQALVVRRAGIGMSLGEQLSSLFYRGAWKTPLHRWLIAGKSPPRLLAVPADPLPGDAARGLGLCKGRILFRGIDMPAGIIGAPRVTLPADGVAMVHRFAWLRDLAAATDRASAAAVAEPLMSGWIAVHGQTVKEPAWRADACAWRLLNCAAHAPLILSSADLAYRNAVLDMLARTARHLDGAAGRARIGHDRMIAWAGVVAAGLLIPEGKARRVVGEAGLARAIAEAILPDGGAVSRSPLALAEAVAMLTMLRNCHAARGEQVPGMIDAAIGRAVPALLGLTHGDGGAGAWQGAGSGEAAEMAALVEASGVRARPLRQARDWGYQRVGAGSAVLLIDAAPPPAAHNARTGCASTLAFEFSSGAERIVINCGGGALTGASVDAGMARALRCTAAHSTLVVADTNSTAVLPGGKLGRGVEEVELDRRDVGKATRIELSHDGYARAFGLTHRRILMVRADGGELRGEDVLVPGRRKRRRAALDYRIHFHLGPAVDAQETGDPRLVLLRLGSGALWHASSAGAPIAIEDSLWIDGTGRAHATRQLVIEGSIEAGGGSAGWLFRRMG